MVENTFEISFKFDHLNSKVGTRGIAGATQKVVFSVAFSVKDIDWLIKVDSKIRISISAGLNCQNKSTIQKFEQEADGISGKLRIK